MSDVGTVESMTGYGLAERKKDGLSVTVEARSVNHRFCEVNVKSTGRLFFIDDHVRKKVKKDFARGYFDLCVTLETLGDEADRVVVNEPLLAAYMKVAEELGRDYGVSYPPTFGELMQAKDLLSVEKKEVAPQVWVDLLEGVLHDALMALALMRTKEGEATRHDVQARLQSVAEMVAELELIEKKAPGERLERLQERLGKLMNGADFDESRLCQEAALLADKGDVSEELERLASHITQVEDLLRTGGPVGRKLEFYVQELGRENNTIGSKTGSAAATALVVQIKSELEKIKEQAQNLV